MAIMVGDNGKDFELPSTGLQPAVCAFVVDLGLQESGSFGEKEKIALVFELAELMKDGRPFLATKFYTKSINKKSTLCKDLESWRSKQFTEDERKGFDVERLIGINCTLNITHSEYNNKTYANIASISPAMKGTQPLVPQNKVLPEWLGKLAETGKKRMQAELDYNQTVATQQNTFDPEPPPAVEDDLPF